MGGELIWIYAVLLFSDGAIGLRDVRIWGPEAVERGGKVALKCLYELEGDTLYATKWYRFDKEFCRYSPREVPPLKVFPIPGIDVDEEKSDATQLTLKHVTRGTAGRYMCEVSADAPSFHTAQVNYTLLVVDLPQGVPAIRGIKSRYRVGSTLRANCSAKNSMPPANLTWYINNNAAHSKYVHYHPVLGDEGLMTATSAISFILTPKHFVNGKIKIRCSASLFDLYWKSTEKSGELEKPRRNSYDGQETPEISVVVADHKPPEPITSVEKSEASGAETYKFVDVVLSTTIVLLLLFANS